MSSKRRYQVLCALDPCLPIDPAIYYMDEWKGWDYFLNKGMRATPYETLVEASAVVKKLGIKSRRQYYRMRCMDLHLPCNPNRLYPDWTGWSNFFGTSYKTPKKHQNTPRKRPDQPKAYKLIGQPQRYMSGHGTISPTYLQRFRFLDSRKVLSVTLQTDNKETAEKRAIEYVERRILKIKMAESPLVPRITGEIRAVLNNYAAALDGDYAKTAKIMISGIIERLQ